VEFNVLVLNTADNNDGDTIVIDARTLTGAVTEIYTTADVTDVNIDVVEPAITALDKSVIATDGTTATYQVTFGNTSGETAYELNVLDLLPANITNLGNVTVVSSSGITGLVDNSTVAQLDIDIATMADTGSITITYTAEVTDDSLVVADTDVDVTWTSISGGVATLGTSSAGASGSTTGERTGSGVGENDYVVAEGAGLSVITGTLWSDADLNTIIGGAETRLPNVQINVTFAGADGIFGNGDDSTFSTLTDVSGDYNFGALASGDYRLSVQPFGMVNGLPSVYSASFDPSGAAADNLIDVTMGEALTTANQNFGVEDIPEPPTGQDNSFSLINDETLNFSALDFGFADGDIGDTMDGVRIDTLPLEGTLTLFGVPVIAGQVIPVADIPNFVFVPTATQVGSVDFTFSVQDQFDGFFDLVPNTFTIVIEARPVVSPPPTPPVVVTPPDVPPSIDIPDPIDPFPPVDFDDEIYTLRHNPFIREIPIPEFWVAASVDEKLIIENKETVFQVSKGIFKHSRPGEILTYESTMEDGSPLPDWLLFDSESLTYKGTAPVGAEKVLEIIIIARDSKGNEVRAPIRVVITREIADGELNVPENDNQDAEIPEENSEEENGEDEVEQEENQTFLHNGRLDFSEQVFNQTRVGQIQKDMAFLSTLNVSNTVIKSISGSA
ncbi:MAG: hypothetical protein JKY11_05055, partial [Alphaproteobacteria bacterium]|nr:hypothetical protein [Alphaproteobacteria bacterium]